MGGWFGVEGLGGFGGEHSTHPLHLTRASFYGRRHLRYVDCEKISVFTMLTA